jgi:hypothetical protein
VPYVSEKHGKKKNNQGLEPGLLKREKSREKSRVRSRTFDDNQYQLRKGQILGLNWDAKTFVRLFLRRLHTHL